MPRELRRKVPTKLRAKVKAVIKPKLAAIKKIQGVPEDDVVKSLEVSVEQNFSLYAGLSRPCYLSHFDS